MQAALIMLFMQGSNAKATLVLFLIDSFSDKCFDDDSGFV